MSIPRSSSDAVLSIFLSSDPFVSLHTEIELVNIRESKFKTLILITIKVALSVSEHFHLRRSA